MLIKTKFRPPDIFFGMMLAVAIFAIGATFLGSQRQWTNDNPTSYVDGPTPKTVSAEERWADYTFALDILTFVLVTATIGLGVVSYIGIRNQTRDTRILERAYVTALLAGVEPWISDPNNLSCDVNFFNAGNLPASKVKWAMTRKISDNPKFDPAPIIDESNFAGDIIIAPKQRIRKGANRPPLGLAELDAERSKQTKECYLYIWGRIQYHDGFRPNRWVDFCHRYNLRGTAGGHIAAGSGRHHEFGNRTDES